MGKPSKRKPQTNRPNPPLKIQDASDFQVLNVLSQPKNWAESGMKCRPLRITHRKRSRVHVSSGFFDRLPPELLDMIFLQLDYGSLARLCATNTKAESYIKNRPYYRLVVEHCYNVLRELSEANFLHVHSAGPFYRVLSNPECSASDCKSTAGYLCLLTCRRYCYQCLGSTPHTRALDTIYVEKKYGICKKELTGNMPCMAGPERLGFSFVLEADLIELVTRLYGEEWYVPREAAWWSVELISAAFPFVDLETKVVEFGRECRACLEAYSECVHLWDEINAPPSGAQEEEWRKEVREVEGTAYQSVRDEATPTTYSGR